MLKLMWLLIMTFFAFAMSIDFLFNLFHINAFEVSVLSILLTVLAVVGMVGLPKTVPGLSIALCAYYILTQFGISWFVTAVPIASLEGSSYYLAGWLYSPNYVRAVELAIVGLLSYAIFVVIGSGSKSVRLKLINYPLNYRSGTIMYRFSIIVLIVALTILIMCLFAGLFSLTGDYIKFRKFSESYEFLWSIIVLLISIGAIFGFSSENRRGKRLFYLLFSIISLIVLATGNKGEIMYPLLAMFGIGINKTGKIDKKYVLGGLIVLLVIIPSITALRYDGVLSNVSQVIFSFGAAFVEMGAQLRLTVFVLDTVGSSKHEFLHGYSYYNPFLTMSDSFIPFISKTPTPDTYASFDKFYKFGFSQVAESFANFGLMGVIIFHSFLGYVTSKWDQQKTDFVKLGLFGVWLSILINMTRNRFSFVPGQFLLVYLVWIFLVFLQLRRNKKKIERFRYS